MSRNANRREAVRYKSGGRCYFCGGEEHELEHLVPLGRGGTNNYSNLVVSCSRCNAAKLRGGGQNDNMTSLEFRRLRASKRGERLHLFFGDVYKYLYDPLYRRRRACTCGQPTEVVARIRDAGAEGETSDNFVGMCTICAKAERRTIIEHGYHLPLATPSVGE